MWQHERAGLEHSQRRDASACPLFGGLAPITPDWKPCFASLVALKFVMSDWCESLDPAIGPFAKVSVWMAAAPELHYHSQGRLPHKAGFAEIKQGVF